MQECSPLLQSCARAMMWQVATSGYGEVWLSSLAFDTRLAYGLSRACPKYVFVWYRDLAYVILLVKLQSYDVWMAGEIIALT